MQKDSKLAQIEKLHKAIYTECEIDLYDSMSYGRRFSQKARNVSFLLYKRAMLEHFKEMGYTSDETKDDKRSSSEVYDKIFEGLKEVFMISIGIGTNIERENKLDKIIKEYSLIM